VRAGGLAPDEETDGAELALRVLEEPQRGGFTVVGARRVRVLGGEPVVDAHEREIELLAENLVEEIGHLR
jgi:hypothetical protein